MCVLYKYILLRSQFGHFCSHSVFFFFFSIILFGFFKFINNIKVTYLHAKKNGVHKTVYIQWRVQVYVLTVSECSGALCVPRSTMYIIM